WHRGRVLKKRENICEAFLIDTGQVLIVEETHLASACDELFHLPPKVVLGVFASILPLGEKWGPKAINYFSSLVGIQVTGHVKAVMPYQLFILEVPKIISDVLELQLGKFIDGDSFCLIVETLRASPQGMLFKELFTYSDSEKPRGFFPVPSDLFPHLPVGSKENVKITVAESPNKFYCQIQKWQKELEDLTGAMHSYYEASSIENNNNSDSLGLLCAAKRQNGQWHRGVVKQLLPDHVEVWLMDFGSTEAVPYSCVQKLRAEFMALPMILFPCALSCFDSQDETVIETQLNKLLQALIEQTSVCVHIDLFNDIKCLYYVTLQNQNLSIDPENLHVAAASPVSVLETKITSIAVNYKLSERDVSFKNCSGNKCIKSCLPEWDSSLSSYCKRVEMQTNSFHTAFVVYVINPSDFWIQTYEYQNEFQALMKKIADTYNKCRADEMVLKDPERGLLCCARYSKDMLYYRGVVTEVLNKSITVYFLDFGNTDTIPCCDVKTLLPEFSHLPALAMCCTLACTFPIDGVWVKKETDFFKEIVFNKVFLLHQKDRYIVNMQCTDDLQRGNIAMCMVQAGYAEYREKTPDSVLHLAKKSHAPSPHKLNKKKGDSQSIHKNCKSKGSGNGEILWKDKLPSGPSVLRESGLSRFGKGAISKSCKSACEKKLFYKEYVFKPGTVFEVVCSYMVSPADFSCQLRSKLPELNKLMEQIQTYYKTHSSPYKTGQGACVVKWPKDGKWYRATVVEVVSTNEVDVVFVDYGYRERVFLEDLQAVLPDFLALESQAFRCALKNVPLETDSFNWSEEVCRHFEDLISASRGPLTCIIYALVLLGPDGLCNIVDLQTPFISAEEFLREHGLAQSEYFGLRNLASIGSLYSFFYSSFNIKIGSEEEVYITHVHNPSKFYCQLNRNTETIEALMNKVSMISKMANNAKFDTSNMRLCIARYFEDGLFYRALAFPVESTSYVCADFVDFGNKNLVERDQLMPIPDSASDLMFTPMQAIKCCLSGLGEAKIPAGITRWFEEAFLGKLLKAVIVSIESDGQIVVELYDGQLQVSQKIKEKMLEESVLTSYTEQFVGRNDEYYQTDMGQNFEEKEQIACRTQKSCNGSSKPLTSQDSGETGSRNTVSAVLEHREDPVVGEPASQPLCQLAVNAKELTLNDPCESPNEKLNYTGEEERSNKNVPKLISLTQRDIQVNSEVTGYISHMNSPSSFYIQLEEDENIIIQLAEELNERMVNIGHENCLDELMVGDLIVAEHAADCCYYRAVIKAVNSENSFEVEFIDYGNAAVVSRSKISRIEKKFSTLPRLSVHCFLSRVENVPDENWGSSSFVSDIMSKLVACKFLQQRGDRWEVDLICDGKSMSDDLLQKKGRTGIVEPKKYNNAECRECETSFRMHSVTWTLLQSGRKYAGFATAVTDPSNFCVQFEVLFNCMKNLSLLLSDLPDNLPALSKKLVAPGTTCLIKCGLEGQWNRAEISEVTRQSVALKFIDYGWLKSIPYSDIHKLKVIPKCLSYLPPLAHSCSLH
ncbi:TDR15 protein, partial [Oreotrochilus melanogaster]|nr:TDR15 protein [Oreotrochilus melanogaster]